ncbi:TPA: hypothetical protein ACY38O_000807 [Pasteurella multocida]
MANIFPVETLSGVLASIVQAGDSNDIKLTIKGKTATAVIRDNQTGAVLTQKMHTERFTEWTSFNPRTVSVDERRDLVYRLIKDDGLTQSEVASYLGISQSQVSKDFNHKKEK